MFIMIINILNNESIVTLPIIANSYYDDWWRYDGFDHDVSSAGLGDPSSTFINNSSSTHYVLPHHLYEKCSTPDPLIPIFLIPIQYFLIQIGGICKWGRFNQKKLHGLF